jgi:hypothetical protein
MLDEMNNFHLVIIAGLILSSLAIGVLVVIEAAIKDRAHRREREEHRRQQNIEWEEQLRRYPWLRALTASVRIPDNVVIGVRRRPRNMVEVYLVAVGGETECRLALKRHHEGEISWKKHGF